MSETGSNMVGTNRIYPNLMFTQFHGIAAGEAHQSMLTGRISRSKWEATFGSL